MGARGQLYELDAENALGRRRVRALARKGLAWSVQREVCSAIMDQHRESLLTLFLSGRLTSIELLRVAFAARHRLVLMQREVGNVFLDQAEAEELMRLALVEGLVARSDGLLKTAAEISANTSADDTMEEDQAALRRATKLAATLNTTAMKLAVATVELAVAPPLTFGAVGCLPVAVQGRAAVLQRALDILVRVRAELGLAQ
jgi:hypothetical protein